MARKKARLPSPSPPPPTPPREESSSDDEEGEEATRASQKAPQNPRPPSTDAADADSSDGGEEEEEEESSDSEADADAFQLREVAPSSGKPSESDADEEDGSLPDSPVPVQKKAKAKAGKKRQAADSSLSGGKAKKAKPDVEKAAAPSGLNASTKAKKKRGKAAPDRSSSKPAVRRYCWATEDEIKILEALASHIKANGKQPSALELIADLGDSLERKNCSKSEMYEKVRSLRLRHEKVATEGILQDNDDDLLKFNLSEAVWGETAKEVAAQNDGASSKSKKGQTNKEKADGHSKGGATKEAATTGIPVKSKKQRGHKEELEGDAKADTTKETTNTATQNGGTLVRSKSGKSDREKKNGDAESLGPKVAMAVTQNDDTLFKNGESHEEKMDTDPNGKNVRKGFHELQNLYPNLTSCVESIQAQHPCGETLKRALELIADEMASTFEAKIKKQRVAEMKMEVRRADTKKEVTNLILGLLG